MTVGYLKTWGELKDSKSNTGTVISTTKTTATLDNGDVLSQRMVIGFNVLASMDSDLQRTEGGYDLDYLVPTLNGEPATLDKAV